MSIDQKLQDFKKEIEQLDIYSEAEIKEVVSMRSLELRFEAQQDDQRLS